MNTDQGESFAQRMTRETDEVLKSSTEHHAYRDRCAHYKKLCTEYDRLLEIAFSERDRINRHELYSQQDVIVMQCRRMELALTMADEPMWQTLQRVMRAPSR